MTAHGEFETMDVELRGYKGEPLPVRTLFFDETPERGIHIVASSDRLRVYMKITPGPKFEGIARETIIGLIYTAGVTYGIITAGIDLFAAMQSGPQPFTGYFQVAVGEPMRKGEDGSIEFHVQPTSFEPRYDEDDAGGIDFKQLNLIENCFAGQRVASILPPGPGRAGTDVFGKELPAVAGTPIHIQPGPGVVVSANGRDFTSEIEGRLVYENDILSVSPILEISRDIDYSVGNVDFVGKVVVNGSLLDGFYINAKRGVELNGEMGAGMIYSEGDVTIRGGVKGKNAAIITCRDLTAHYIDDTAVEATGDVTATKEIINSSVKALGRITVTTGAIIGGEVCGFMGVEADTLGSEMGVQTWVLSGLNWTEENRKNEIRGQVAELMERVQASQVLLNPLLADKEVTAKLGTEQKSMLSELISELREVRESLAVLLEERASLDGHRQEGMVNHVNVRKVVYMGVSVRFSEVEGQVKDSVKGPVSITQNAAGGAIAMGQFRELPKRERKEEA